MLENKHLKVNRLGIISISAILLLPFILILCPSINQFWLSRDIKFLSHTENTKKVAFKFDYHQREGSHLGGVNIRELRTYSGDKNQIEAFYNKNGVKLLDEKNGDSDDRIYFAFVENLSYGKNGQIWEKIDNKSWNVTDNEKNEFYVIVKSYVF